MTDFANKLPQRLALRFRALGTYVHDLIEEIEEEKPVTRKMSKEQVAAIHAIVFVASLDRLFRDGARAAEEAVDTLVNLGAGGFSVGSTVFEGRNENVLMGRELSSELRRYIQDQRILSIIDTQVSPRKLVRALYEAMYRGQ